MRQCKNCYWSDHCKSDTPCEDYTPFTESELADLAVRDYVLILAEDAAEYSEFIKEFKHSPLWVSDSEDAEVTQ